MAHKSTLLTEGQRSALAKLALIMVIVVFAVAGVYLTFLSHAAGNGTVSLTPSASSFKVGDPISITVREDTGSVGTNDARIRFSFQTDKLDFDSIDISSSAFGITTPDGGLESPGTIFVDRASFSLLTGNQTVFVAKFKAKAAGTVSITADNNCCTLSRPDDSAPPDHPATLDEFGTFKGTSFSIASPTPPPSNLNPPADNSSGNTGNTDTNNNTTNNTAGNNSAGNNKSNGSTGNKSGGSSSSANNSTSGNNSSSSSSTPTTSSDVAASTIKFDKIEFTRANVTLTNSKPVSVYIRYGDDKTVPIKTPTIGPGTSLPLTIDQGALTPGTSYFFQVVTIGADGHETAGELQSFKTKGYTASFVVLGKTGSILKNLPVTLHSEPQIAKTDSHGKVTFTDVSPGEHTLEAKDGKRKISQSVTVADTFKEVNGAQAAATQNFTLTYSIAPNSNTPTIIVVVIMFLLGAAAGVYFLLFKKRLLPIFGNQKQSAPVIPVAPAPADPGIPKSAQETNEELINKVAVTPRSPGNVITPTKPAETPLDPPDQDQTL